MPAVMTEDPLPPIAELPIGEGVELCDSACATAVRRRDPKPVRMKSKRSKVKEVGRRVSGTCVARSGGGKRRRQLSQAAPSGQVCGSEGADERCCDAPPPGDFTCSQQVEWGKCADDWLIEGGYCALSCGFCNAAPEKPLYLFLAGGQGLASPQARRLVARRLAARRLAQAGGPDGADGGAEAGDGGSSLPTAFVLGYQGQDDRPPEVSVGTLEDSGLPLARKIGGVLGELGVSTPGEFCDEGARRRRSLAQAPPAEGSASGDLGVDLSDVPFDALDFGITQTTWEDSSVVTDWNPDSMANTWPRDEDDGSARYLSQFVDLAAKDKLYVNFNFMIRETQELLAEEGLVSEMESLFWVHAEGSADEYSWDVLAGSYSRLFTALREDLGQPDLPIIDFGAGGSDVLNTAKSAAAAEIGGMEVVSFAVPGARPGGDCNPETDLCGAIPKELQDLYGVDSCDPNAPEDAQTFEWFAECSAGAPMGLEAENLSGEMMTEAYIRQLPGGVDALGGAGLDAAPGGIAKCADSEALLARSVDSWCWDDLSTPQSAEARASSALNAARG